jgi:hypothetical protein
MLSTAVPMPLDALCCPRSHRFLPSFSSLVRFLLHLALFYDSAALSCSFSTIFQFTLSLFAPFGFFPLLPFSALFLAALCSTVRYSLALFSFSTLFFPLLSSCERVCLVSARILLTFYPLLSFVPLLCPTFSLLLSTTSFYADVLLSSKHICPLVHDFCLRFRSHFAHFLPAFLSFLPLLMSSFSPLCCPLLLSTQTSSYLPLLISFCVPLLLLLFLLLLLATRF